MKAFSFLPMIFSAFFSIGSQANCVSKYNDQLKSKRFMQIQEIQGHLKTYRILGFKQQRNPLVINIQISLDPKMLSATAASFSEAIQQNPLCVFSADKSPFKESLAAVDFYITLPSELRAKLLMEFLKDESYYILKFKRPRSGFGNEISFNDISMEDRNQESISGYSLALKLVENLPMIDTDLATNLAAKIKNHEILLELLPKNISSFDGILKNIDSPMRQWRILREVLGIDESNKIELTKRELFVDSYLFLAAFKKYASQF